MIYILAFQVIPGKYPQTKRGLTPAMGVVFLLFFGFLLFVIIYSLLRYAFLIKIDPEARTISFSNIINFSDKTYDFNEFQSYLDTSANSKSGQYKNTNLIQAEQPHKIIT